MDPTPKNTIKQVHVLIVDDDEALQRLFGGYLSAAGFEVEYSQNGDEGREIARRLQPDVILLDLKLPGMDGYELSAKLKSEELTKKIPLIIMTSADISKEAEDLLKQNGVNDFIHKSVGPAEFVERVKAVLNRHDPKKNEPKESILKKAIKMVA